MLRLALPLLGLLPGAVAWGRDGHKITAQVAQALLSEDEVSRATSILGGDDLAAVANWADEIRDDDEWKWTEASHFINTPDGQCSFDYNRDCKDRDGRPDYCVAGAILNYTAYLLSGTEDQDMMQIALKFIVHFAGDIHQPLHVGWTTDQGGNKIHVEDSWEGDKERNLHQVWDEGLINGIEDRAGLKEEDLARNLTQELQSGSMQGSLQAWSSCGDSGDKSALLKCLEQIATESVQDACKYAYTDAQGNRVADREDLDEAYYTSRAQVVRSRLAAGGARLAAILKYVLPKSHAKSTIVV